MGWEGGWQRAGAYLSQLRVQDGCVDKVFERALLGQLHGGINHVESHDGLSVGKRRFDMVDDRRVFEDALRLLGQAEVGADDLCVGVFLPEALLRLGGVTDQAQAPPVFGDLGEEGRGLLSAGAGDDEEVVFVVDGGGGGGGEGVRGSEW